MEADDICVCFLSESTVQALDVVLNPPAKNDWRKVAEALGYSVPQIKHFQSLVLPHGSHFRTMLDKFKERTPHSVREFVRALHATERKDVKHAIRNLHRDVQTEYSRVHRVGMTQSCSHMHQASHCSLHNSSHFSQPLQCHHQRHNDYIHTNRINTPCCFNQSSPRLQNCHPSLCPPAGQNRNLCSCQAQGMPDNVLPIEPQAPVHFRSQSEFASACPLDTFEPSANLPLERAEGSRYKETEMTIKSEYGLQHPPFTPIPGGYDKNIRIKQEVTDSADNQMKFEAMEFTDYKPKVERSNHNSDANAWSNHRQKRPDSIGESPVISGESCSSGDSVKSNTYPRYGRQDDACLSDLANQLQGSCSAQARLETATFSKAVKEVFVTYADDKDTLKSVYQLLDTLQRNRFKTSADEKEREGEGMLEKVQRRYQRCDFVVVCVCPKYREQVNPRSPLHYINRERSLHTEQIYNMMRREVEENQGNDRIIPVLMKGATMKDVPDWLRKVCPREIFYKWPSQYKSLLFHLLEPKKLVERYEKYKDMSKRSLQITDKKLQPAKKLLKFISLR